MKKLFCSVLFCSVLLIGCQKNLDVDLPPDSLSKDTTATQRDGDNNLYSKEYILEYLEANEPID